MENLGTIHPSLDGSHIHLLIDEIFTILVYTRILCFMYDFLDMFEPTNLIP